METTHAGRRYPHRPLRESPAKPDHLQIESHLCAVRYGIFGSKSDLAKRDTPFQMRLTDLKTGGAASSQQVALGGFTAAKAARRLAECGYNELPENGG